MRKRHETFCEREYEKTRKKYGEGRKGRKDQEKKNGKDKEREEIKVKRKEKRGKPKRE